MSAFQFFACVIAAFYAFDNAISAFVASPGNGRRYVWRCIIGIGLSLVLFGVGTTQ